MANKYTVRDDSTGNVVTFAWDGDTPPSDADMEQVFAQARGQSPAPATAPKNYQQDYIDSMPGWQKFAVGVGSGMDRLYQGVKQAATQGAEAVGLAKPGATQELTRRVQSERDLVKPLTDTSTAAKVGEFVGETAPTLLIPGGGAAGVGRRLAVDALTGAALGAAQFVPEGGSRLEQGVVGGLAAGAGSGVLSAGGKVVNAVKGPVKGATRQLADKFSIPLSLGEETGKAGVQRGEVLLERAPGFLGLTGFRQKQAKAAEDAARAHFAEYVANPASLAHSTADVKVANDLHLDQLYDVVRANGKTVPSAPAPEVKATASSLLDEYPDVFEKIQSTKVKGILKNIVGDTADKTVSQTTPRTASPVFGWQGGQQTTKSVTPTFSFDDLWKLRMGLGREMGAARDPIAKGQLKALYASVSSDIDSMLGKAGVADDFKAANEAFKKYSVKFDALREAYDKAVGTVGAGEIFSPKKYSTALKNLANDPNFKRQIQWSPQEIDHMTGLANILQVVKRAGQYMENPPTGSRWGALGAVLGGETAALLAGGPTAAAGAISAPLVAKFLTTTEAGKRLALAASKVEPTSPLMKSIVGMVYKQIPRSAAVGAAQQ